MSPAIRDALTTSQLAAAGAKSFDALLRAHVAEHRRLFRRVALDLGARAAAAAEPSARPTSASGTSPRGGDPQLAALYFQFGRYLLISSSRPGTQPANLQGDWNEQMKPPWESKYTININTEMNYWPAESTNLSEFVEPLTRLVLDLAETGARTAKVQYGARGWVAHHNTDLWRAIGARRRAGIGHVADRRRVALSNALGALRVHAGPRVSRADLSSHERRVGVLPRHARRGAGAQVAGHRPVRVAGEPASVRQHHADAPGRRWTCRSSAICSRTRFAPPRSSPSIARCATSSAATRGAARAESDRQGRPAAGVARRLGHGGSRPASPPRLAPVRAVSRARRSPSAARRRSRPPRASRSRFAATTRPAGALGWRLNLWARLQDGEHAYSDPRAPA